MEKDEAKEIPQKDNSNSDMTIEENDQISFENELIIFIDNISSLSGTLEITLDAIKRNIDELSKEFNDFTKENIIFREIEGKKEALIRADKKYQLECYFKKLKSYHLAQITIPRSYIISLISQYDSFLGGILRVVFLLKPEILNSSERNITFSQLIEFGSVDDARDHFLEKEIETILRKSHSEHFQCLEKKINIKLRPDKDTWANFIELTERRNLFVHNGGKVTSQYLKVCNEHNVDIKDTQLNDELVVNQDYFKHAYNVIFEIGIKLAHVLWRKFKPEELELADENLIDIGFDTLHDEDYINTKMIFNFGCQVLHKHNNDENRRIMIINQALAYKWDGDNKKAKQIIVSEDWTATRGRYRLAEAIILDDFDSAYKIMEEIGDNDREIGKANYRNWPLFKAIKNEQNFLDLFQQIFNEPYNKIDEDDTDLPKEIIDEK